MKIGAKLKHLRKTKKLTLKELAEKSGVQIATLSRMERDMMTGTLDSHIKITKALGVSLAEFFREVEDDFKSITFIGQKERGRSLLQPKESTIEMLTTKFMGKKMVPILLRLKKNAHIAKDACAIGSEKFLYLLEGNIRAIIGREEYSLRKGDSVYFDASLPHTFHNIARIESLVLSIFAPASDPV
jgi:transcriptional regulator with XRE-family HTH domain